MLEVHSFWWLLLLGTLSGCFVQLALLLRDLQPCWGLSDETNVAGQIATSAGFIKSMTASHGAAQVGPKSQTVLQEVDVPEKVEEERLDVLAKVFVINVGQAKNRWEHMQTALGDIFGKNRLPALTRFDALTPDRDDCDLPYSLGDCCTKSHQALLRAVAKDDSIRDDQWVIVLEDDVALHPKVQSNHFGEIITDGFAKAGRAMSPFVYLGLCGPICFGTETLLMTTSGATVPFQSHCGGSCTHAYAVQKFIAGYLPTFIEMMDPRARTIDAAFSLMTTSLNMSLLGGSYQSPDKRAAGTSHLGIFYMKSFDDSLTTSTAWDKRVKVHVRLGEWSGRMGNLMFQWAATMAFAEKAEAGNEVYFDVNPAEDSPECPAAAFFKHYRLQRFSRDMRDLRQKHPKAACVVNFKESAPNIYPRSAVNKVFKDVAKLVRKHSRLEPSDPERCSAIHLGPRDVHVSLVVLLRFGFSMSQLGYFQSWVYFKQSSALIRRAYRAPPATESKALAWKNSVLETLVERYPKRSAKQWVFIGVQVRRGDKVHDQNFASIYFNVDWAYFKAAMVLLEDRLKKNRTGTSVAFLVTAGGSMDSNREDVAETKAAFQSVSKNVFFSDNDDPQVDHAILASCDGIIISPGSFGWWAAYLSPAGQQEGLVVAPKYLYRPYAQLANGYSVEDYNPTNWHLLDNDVGTPESDNKL